MKTELVLGKEVVRVDEVNGPCCATNREERISCEFLDEFLDKSCRINGRYACNSEPVIFIRPDQILEYLALKLVS